jgi:hypothetical protein
MTLEEDVKQIQENFENVSTTHFLDVVKQIQERFQSNLTREYLGGKVNAINETSDEHEKKKLCKNLLPYLDWYIQGL